MQKKCKRKRGVFVAWLQNKALPPLPAPLPHEHTAPALTDPEIWLFNCFWPNFCFPSLLFLFLLFRSHQSLCFCIVLWCARESAEHNALFLLGVESEDCLLLRDITREGPQMNTVCVCVVLVKFQ